MGLTYKIHSSNQFGLSAAGFRSLLSSDGRKALKTLQILNTGQCCLLVWMGKGFCCTFARTLNYKSKAVVFKLAVCEGERLSKLGIMTIGS